MTSPLDEDAYWRRPAEDEPTHPAGPTRESVGYEGPPRPAQPPPYWSTPVVQQPPAARELPPQDHERLDAQEQAARTVTYGVAMLAGAVAFILLLVICAGVLTG